jgi:hypothetical protein
VRWYRQALDATGDRDDHQRCDLMVRLGDTERQAGDPAYRGRLLDAARLAQQLEDRDLLVGRLANNRGYRTVGQVDTERVAVLEAALDAVGHDDSAQRARARHARERTDLQRRPSSHRLALESVRSPAGPGITT